MPTAYVSEQVSKTRRQMRDRVKRGAKLLDEKRPDWFKKIEVWRLDMQHGDKCILGQAFMNGNIDPYSKGLVELGISRLSYDHTVAADELAHKYGFDLDIHYYDFNHNQYMLWSMLAEYWIVEIEKRQGA